MTIGQRIAQKRKELGLSQEALGAELGVSRQSIYKWESDAALPEIDKLIALSRRFAVSVGWLLGVEEPAPAAVGKSVPDGNPAGNEHSGAMGSGEPPADGPQELTPAQLQMVEAIVERYTAALPKPLSRQKRRLAKAGITLGILCLLGGLLGRKPVHIRNAGTLCTVQQLLRTSQAERILLCALRSLYNRRAPLR